MNCIYLCVVPEHPCDVRVHRQLVEKDLFRAEASQHFEPLDQTHGEVVGGKVEAFDADAERAPGLGRSENGEI